MADPGAQHTLQSCAVLTGQQRSACRCPNHAPHACNTLPSQLLTRLAEDREVVVFDQMRSGLSTDTSTAPLTIQLMASNTAGLIRALKLDKPDVWRCARAAPVAL